MAFLPFGAPGPDPIPYCNRKWGLAARCPKANREARVVERKVCLILDAGDCREEAGVDSCPKADTPPCNRQSVGKNFYRQREGAIWRNSKVSSDSHLEIDHWWSDQHHLDCVKYNQSSVPDLVCSRFCEASSRNCGSFYYGYGEGSGTPLQYSCLEHPWMEEADDLSDPGIESVSLTSPALAALPKQVMQPQLDCEEQETVLGLSGRKATANTGEEH
ncbi:hypothetical protein MG293_002158 [Ovis ammon polii]|uniref:Uncharacterized protein n=1 Tax=Ovis ammon polii TaxID=230172 RepID=A0AAD4UM96_OVIAM|nr:hypothetical protein MG293_002158 [Ovis ammon polii]